MTRLLWLPVLAVICGCATPTFIRMSPAPGQMLDVTFKNGTPVVVSHGRLADVGLSPVAGPTGRYQMGDRIALMVKVRNKGGQRIEVSESNLSVQVNGMYARVLMAVEVEDEIRTSAAWAQAVNAVATGMATLGTSMTAGQTTHSGQVGGVAYSGTSTNSSAARQEVRQVQAGGAARSAEIAARESAAIGGVAALFQQNTIEPGDWLIGGVVVEFARDALCVGQATEAGVPPTPDPGLCRLDILATVAEESHRVTFVESFVETGGTSGWYAEEPRPRR
ncbi:MAG: hypothetical protein HY928_14350 [Elusimicrobia bacterium]|nr:hypothetical protein [Elusimicrobiota bacterium]